MSGDQDAHGAIVNSLVPLGLAMSMYGRCHDCGCFIKSIQPGYCSDCGKNYMDAPSFERVEVQMPGDVSQEFLEYVGVFPKASEEDLEMEKTSAMG